MSGDSVLKYGEIEFDGSSVSERILDAKRKVHALSDQFDVSYIAIESAVMVRSPAVAIKMAYVFGAIMGELLESGSEVVEVAPITWQSYIGNKVLTKEEKALIRKDNPGKSKSWYTNKSREFRKQRTMNFFNSRYGLALDSDNVSDAFGLAYYATNHLTEL
jgi:hypothetical protein